MDPNSRKNAPRKMKFAPKPPPRRPQNPVLPKVEKVEDAVDDAQTQELLRRLNESQKPRPKTERKGGFTQAAFGSAGPSTLPKSYSGSPRVNYYNRPNPLGGRINKPKKEYQEPWNYYSYYPESHPQRRPYSGDPEVLNEEEFREDEEDLPYDEDSTKPAVELGLLEENTEERMFFFQLPAKMPMAKEKPNANGNEDVGKKQRVYNLHELPAGFMGKLLVYKSGAVKLKIGDNLFDVSEGVDCSFVQDTVAINTKEKQCCFVGELNKFVVVTPDVDHMLADDKHES